MTKARHDNLVAQPLTNMRMGASIEEHRPVGLDIAFCRECHDQLGEQIIRNSRALERTDEEARFL